MCNNCVFECRCSTWCDCLTARMTSKVAHLSAVHWGPCVRPDKMCSREQTIYRDNECADSVCYDR